MAAALTAVAAPTQAAIFIGIQETGVNGGAITNVANGTLGAGFAGSYGTFEFNNLTGTIGISPTVLNSTSTNISSDAGGTIDIYVARTDIGGGTAAGYLSGFTTNLLPVGWTVQERTYINVGNNFVSGSGGAATFNIANIGSLIGNVTFIGAPGLQTAAQTSGSPSTSGPYTVVERYTLVATGNGNANSTITVQAVPEPGTWALMIMGFGGAGAMLRSRRRVKAALA
jgi:hypothetical protein